jgi:hypothetical protein
VAGDRVCQSSVGGCRPSRLVTWIISHHLHVAHFDCWQHEDGVQVRGCIRAAIFHSFVASHAVCPDFARTGINFPQFPLLIPLMSGSRLQCTLSGLAGVYLLCDEDCYSPAQASNGLFCCTYHRSCCRLLKDHKENRARQGLKSTLRGGLCQQSSRHSEVMDAFV